MNVIMDTNISRVAVDEIKSLDEIKGMNNFIVVIQQVRAVNGASVCFIHLVHPVPLNWYVYLFSVYFQCRVCKRI